MHPLLARQLKKLGFTASDVPKVLALLETVSRTYSTSDEDRARLERALDFSSQEMHEKYEQIQHQALYDRLTGLLNRNSFHDEVEIALASVSNHGRGCAVLNIDLDNFKLINDTLGHDFGDVLLVIIADRLRSHFAPELLTARMGGDEFSLLIPELESKTDAESVALEVIEIIQDQVVLQGAELNMTARIGIAVELGAGQTVSEILRHANIAMNHCKSARQTMYAFHDESMEEGFADRLELAMSLRSALEKGEFFVQYQPLVDLDSGRVSGAEALLRWHRPDQGLISPVRFIPVAEDTGLIVPIGNFVLETACAAMRKWNDKFSGEPRMISVNLSGRQLQQNDFVETIDRILTQSHLRPENLKLEITESMLMSDIDDVAFKLASLKEQGIHLALDDFGTGYSSLATLTSFPIDTLKVDRSFLSQLESSRNAKAVVAAIVGLANAMGQDVTCEGVETAEQLKIVRDLGCRNAQGYLFSKPIGGREIEALFAAGGSYPLDSDDSVKAA